MGGYARERKREIECRENANEEEKWVLRDDGFRD